MARVPPRHTIRIPVRRDTTPVVAKPGIPGASFPDAARIVGRVMAKPQPGDRGASRKGAHRKLRVKK